MQIMQTLRMKSTSISQAEKPAKEKRKWFSRPKGKANHNSGRGRKILSKLSGAFLLPIAIMSVAGIFLGVGAAIASNAGDNAGLKTFGNFIQAIGNPVFGALPLLFAAGFVIAFTDEAGVAVFSVIIAYLVFVNIQQAFIYPINTEAKAIETLADGTTKEHTIKTLTGYDILWYNGGLSGRDPVAMKGLVGDSLGFKSLQTSVFGGIIIGLIVAFLYRKFNAIKFWSVFNFFAGKRFIPIISVLAMVPLAFLFLIFWPWVGQGLAAFGEALGKATYGDSFIFGYVERSLVPFGLHHVFYSALWYTQVGGDLSSAYTNFTNAGHIIIDPATNAAVVASEANTASGVANWVYSLLNKQDIWQGDSTISLQVVKQTFNDVTFRLSGNTENQTLPLYAFIQDQFATRVGRFMQGKYTFMQMGLPFAALAMVMAAPKDKRKLAMSAVLPAAFTSFLTGITEPIEFTFLFLSPFLFWGVHAFLCAVAFLLLNVLSVHLAMSFSGGLIDMIIYGMLPVQKGTNFWWAYVVGLGYAPAYFFIFYYYIKWKNLATPGRGDTVKLFSKDDYKAKGAKVAKGDLDPKLMLIIEGMGGFENIMVYENCASRLRYDVKDTSKVSQEKLKAAGAFGVQITGSTHVQAIFGPSASPINAQIHKYKEEYTTNPDKFKNYAAESAPVVEETKAETPSATTNKLVPALSVKAPISGTIHDLGYIDDGVFSAGLLGNGVVITPSEDKGVIKLYSPVDGTLETVMDSLHAYGITTKDGVKFLLHVGIDTVNLKGQGFKTVVKQGDQVKQGQLLGAYNVDFLKTKVAKTDLIMILLDESQHKEMKDLKLENVNQNDEIFKVE
ncbi:PTS transporter subunit IIABC [Mycoplasmopsis agassizii]|nr:PTS transporter subunit IIABC [Mycoplasmopsis agassizii]